MHSKSCEQLNESNTRRSRPDFFAAVAHHDCPLLSLHSWLDAWQVCIIIGVLQISSPHHGSGLGSGSALNWWTARRPERVPGSGIPFFLCFKTAQECDQQLACCGAFRKILSPYQTKLEKWMSEFFWTTPTGQWQWFGKKVWFKSEEKSFPSKKVKPLKESFFLLLLEFLFKKLLSRLTSKLWSIQFSFNEKLFSLIVRLIDWFSFNSFFSMLRLCVGLLGSECEESLKSKIWIFRSADLQIQIKSEHKMDTLCCSLNSVSIKQMSCFRKLGHNSHSVSRV